MTLLNRLGLKNRQPVEVAPPAPPRQFFFVRGHPRSGTNWVGALLNLHPKINCFGEFHFEDIRNAIDTLQGHVWQITSREPLKSELDRCFEDLVRRCMRTLESRKPGAEWIGDRTPRGLRVFLEGAPYIMIARDGRDVLLSWTYHVLRQRPHVVDVVVPAHLRSAFQVKHDHFNADHDYFRKHPEELLTDEGWVRFIAGRWANWMRADREAVRQIQQGELNARVLPIRYEELHADTEGGRRAMYRFLGLNPDEAAPLGKENRTTPGFDQEDPTSFWRHGRIGDWKRYSNDRFKLWFKEAAGEALVECGYEKDNNW
ncbi:MAG: sulfotransferase [Phycisphaeraceae bacterium]|nr:sulfotransferase [Phycisphaeraceae bacterium]